MNIKDKLKSLPETPGVYLMKDKDNNTIYIGKSKCLKNRVSQYFTPSYAPSKKISRMIKFIEDIEIIKTDTELDALLLECSLIKKVQPMYNTLMKNDKKYAYLKIDINEEYPTLDCAMNKNDESLYFGPYTSLKKLEDISDILIKYFKIRKCRGTNKLRGCINYDLDFCLGPCKLSNKQEYDNSIQNLIDTLNGKNSDILIDLNDKMMKATQVLDFEKALKYRNDIENIKSIIHKSEAINYIKTNKAILLTVDIDDRSKKIYILKGIKIIYSKVVKIQEIKTISLKNKIKRYINKDLISNTIENVGYVKKEELDIAYIICSYLKYSADCEYLEIDNLDLDKVYI